MSIVKTQKALLPVRRDKQIPLSAAGSVAVGTGGGGGGSVIITAHSLLSQLDYASAGHTGFAPSANPTFTGTVVLPSTTSIGTVSATEIGYLDGVTSAIQTQLNAKAPLASPTFTGTVTLPILKVTTGAAAGNILISGADGTLGYLAAGATTKILVGGGAANPVWTEATGTGAPVRAGSPTFTTKINVTGDIYGSNRIIAGGLTAIDSEAQFQGKIDTTLDYQYLLRFKDEAGTIGLIISNGLAAGNFFPVFTGKVTSTYPAFYFVGNCVNGPGSGAPIIGFDGRINNAAAAATDILIGFSSGYGTIKAGILGNGTFYTAGGVHVGGTSDPGVDNLLVDGTCAVTGISTFTGLIKTVGGVHIGGTSDPGADNLIVDGTSLFTGVSTFNTHLTANEAFVSGFMGSGWKLEKGTDYSLTVDNLTVRKKMRVYELEINKINSVNGGIMVSVANGKAYSVGSKVLNINYLWTNVSFETFSSSGLNINSAINSSGVGSASLPSYTTTTGEKITVNYNLWALTGAAPTLAIGTDFYALSAGINSFTHTVVAGAPTVFTIQTGASASEFSLVLEILTNTYKIFFDEDESTAGTGNIIQFQADDYVRAQEWTGRGVDVFEGKVLSVNHSDVLGAAYIRVLSDDTCWAGADIVQVGNSTDVDRQNMIYITAADDNNPYIQMVSGVTDGDFTDHTKVFLGNLKAIAGYDIVPEYIDIDTPGFGLYGQNVYLSGTIVALGGSIGGWTITSTALYKDGGGATLSAGMKPDDYPFYAGQTYANRNTAPFRVTTAGAMYATSGAIGGFTIDSTNLYAGTGATRVQMSSSAGFWAGATAIGDAPFSVTNAGVLKATGIAELGTAAGNDPEAAYTNAVAIKGCDIYEPSRNDDTGSLYINGKGYQGGVTKYRNTYISDGKGGYLMEFVGAKGTIAITKAFAYRPYEFSANTTPSAISYSVYIMTATTATAKTLTFPVAADISTQFGGGKSAMYPQIIVINKNATYNLNITTVGNADTFWYAGANTKTYVLAPNRSVIMQFSGDEWYVIES